MAVFRFVCFLGVLLVACAAAMDDKQDAEQCKNCTVTVFEEGMHDDDTTPKLLDNMVQLVEDSDLLDVVSNDRKRRSAYDYGYGNGYGNEHYASGGYASGGYGGYGGYSRYEGQGYGNGYNNKGYVGYDHSYTKSPVLTYVKGFKPGKTYVEKGKVVRNYYRHGTYEVALQHYKFIPVVKVVPYTTYDTIGYTGHIQAHNDYTAVICKDCYHGYAKIDVTAHKAPYSYVTRRFVYLPENYRIDGYVNHGYGSYNSYGHH